MPQRRQRRAGFRSSQPLVEQRLRYARPRTRVQSGFARVAGGPGLACMALVQVPAVAAGNPARRRRFPAPAPPTLSAGDWPGLCRTRRR